MLKAWNTFYASLVFYTCLPLSASEALDFRGIAVYAPIAGVLIGGILGVTDFCLTHSNNQSHLLQATLITCLGLLLTGGLHLDGAMDTADGLAVTDGSKRLEVMSDSNSGAYGVMAAIAIFFLKISALVAIHHDRFGILIAVGAWARWGQLYAIVNYDYLKPEGKGKFHKDHVHSWQVGLMGAVLMLGSLGFGFYRLDDTVTVTVICLAIAIGTGAWFNWQLGGHTGDTYGAIVEWTEALSLCAIALILPIQTI